MEGKLKRSLEPEKQDNERRRAGKDPCLCLMGRRDSVDRTYFEGGYWFALGGLMESPTPLPL